MPKDDDTHLFHEQLGTVTPLKGTRKVSVRPPKRRTKLLPQPDFVTQAEATLDTTRQPAPVGREDRLSYQKNGVQPETLKLLRQGKLLIDAELDLHGYTVAQTELSLAKFLESCQQTHKRVLRIIHGKGHTSQTETPPIKNTVNIFLQRHPYVLAFCSAPSHQGGAGVVTVLLVRHKKP
jgi:DNA-nicking Smr family endonuclease